MMKAGLIVVGGGLAGAEAAYQAAERGVRVALYEMRPVRSTPAHRTAWLAELVCSNSLRSAEPFTAPGLLKEEIRRMGSLILQAAEACRVPGGSALAVDRECFARRISEAIEEHPRIQVVREEVTQMPPGPAIIATGPLTSDAMAEAFKALTGNDALAFYDAISPIVDAETLDPQVVFPASRYGKGGADYLNCPLSREEYTRFYEALRAAERMPEHPFEKIPYFEGCMPIEVMAERGFETLAFGPMRPVGLVDPRTCLPPACRTGRDRQAGRRPFAVVQLRQENHAATLYNLVGFQTKLTYPEQRRVFRLIPGLSVAEFVRYGSLHRNTFLNAPRLLRPTLQLKAREDLFVAGQLTGVEGYMESAAMGLLAGINAARILQGLPGVHPPATTAMGSLIHHLTEARPEDFQPMNVTFGLMPPLPQPIRDRRLRRQQWVVRALRDLERWRQEALGEKTPAGRSPAQAERSSA